MKERLMKNFGYLIVLLDIGIYFILSYVYVKDFQQNILATIVNSSLLFMGAIIATNALMKQGILKGRDSQKYKETLTSHIMQKQKIYPNIKYLKPWLDKDYYKLLKMGRTVYVNSAGYDYEELFSEQGKRITKIKVNKPIAIIYTTKWQKCTAWIRRLCRWIFSDDWHIYRQNKRFIRKANRYKITRQTVSYLINIDADKDPNDYGETESQYTKRQNGMAVASRLFFSVGLQSVAFGFYGWNIETFLIQMLSVVLILISALSSMYNAYFFMVKTHRETIIKKINKLEEFDHADIEELKATEKAKKEDKKEDKPDEICATICETSQSPVVEEIHGELESGEQDNLCGNTNTGV